MPLASLELPCRAFPSRGAVPALAGPLASLWVRVSTAADAVPAGVSRPLFPVPRQLFARSSPPGGGPRTHEPGRRFLAIARPVASTRDRAARTVPLPPTLGSPVSGRHARFEALLPPGVRSATIPVTWPGPGPPVGALLGFLPSRALSTTVLGSVCHVDARREPKPRATCASGRPAVAVACRDPDSDPGF